jgi:hypothetical protein
MAKTTGVSNKYSEIVKANNAVTISVGIATFLVIFSLFACYALLGQRSFHARVIKEKEVAKQQLEQNKAAVDALVVSYQNFVNQEINAIGGTKDGKGDNDGDNGRIVLDALPSKYDFPAVVSSLEKMLTDKKMPILEIVGIDESLNQDATVEGLVSMPFEVSTEANFDSIFKIMAEFERSIRPFNANIVTITATDEGIQLDFSGTTYYLPETGLKIEKKVVR